MENNEAARHCLLTTKSRIAAEPKSFGGSALINAEPPTLVPLMLTKIECIAISALQLVWNEQHFARTDQFTARNNDLGVVTRL
jgi:hypothetical protein